MTPRERILATFEHEPVDKVPIHHLGFSSDAASKILGREAFVGGGIQQWREAKALWQGEEAHREFLKRSLEDAYELAKATEQDMIRFHYWRLPIKPTKKIDEYTFLYGDPTGEWVVRRFLPEYELFNIVDEYPRRPKMTLNARFREIEKDLSEREAWLEVYRPKREDFTEIRQLMETRGKEYAIRIFVDSLDVGIDQKDWLIAMTARHDLAARHLDIRAEATIRKIRYLAEAGVKFISGGTGDIATNDGPIFSPRTFREIILPRLQRITEECHKYGMYFLYASDGNLWPIADDLFGKSGIDGYCEIDRRAGMDLHDLRRRFPELVLFGNISSYTLHLGTEEQVINETLSCLKEARRSRGIVVGISNYIVPGTPKENILAMIETIRRYR